MRPARAVRIASDGLWVDILPDKGADVYAIIDEPQAANPAIGLSALRARGTPALRLEAGGTTAATISVTVEHLE